jgi:hypothetical protein
VLGLLYLPSSSFSFLGSLSHACGHPLRNIAVYRRRYTLVPPYLSLSLSLSTWPVYVAWVCLIACALDSRRSSE